MIAWLAMIVATVASAADVAHVGIHGFAASHRQKDTTEYGDPAPAVFSQQRDPVARIDGGDHRGVAGNADDT